MKKLNSVETAFENLKLSTGKGASEHTDKYIKVINNDKRKSKVFLGGTCNGSTWREELIPYLEEAKIKYFNPVLEDWNDKAKGVEDKEKLKCGIHLYVITPEMKGLYSIAEAVDSAYKNPKGTFLVVIGETNDKIFNKDQVNSLESILKLVRTIYNRSDRTMYFDSLNDESLKLITDSIKSVKRGFANRVIFDVQSHPISYSGINGIQDYDIINFGKQVLKANNKLKSCVENANAIRKISGALSELDKK